MTGCWGATGPGTSSGLLVVIGAGLAGFMAYFPSGRLASPAVSLLVMETWMVMGSLSGKGGRFPQTSGFPCLSLDVGRNGIPGLVGVNENLKVVDGSLFLVEHGHQSPDLFRQAHLTPTRWVQQKRPAGHRGVDFGLLNLEPVDLATVQVLLGIEAAQAIIGLLECLDRIVALIGADAEFMPQGFQFRFGLGLPITYIVKIEHLSLLKMPGSP
jgi:hypothetical protein